ncbi:MAG: Fur family transcriptional regulator [Deltaproteobacteria bacterium]
MKKSRNTRQRAVILDILRKSEAAHPTADTIYREARKALPNISLGTVYRNLNFLREQGLVHEIRSNTEASSRFECDCPPHAHFHCARCQAVYDIPLPECLRNLEWDEALSISSINSMELHLLGACRNCGSAHN